MKIDSQNFKEYQAFALVTGAASGMGKLYAGRLAMMGYSLVIVDISADRLEKTADELREQVASLSDWRIPYKSSFKVLPLVQDLSRQDAAEKVYAFTGQHGCDIEVLINNAGLFYYQGIAETSPAALAAIF